MVKKKGKTAKKVRRERKEIGKLVKKRKYRGISLRPRKELIIAVLVCAIILTVAYGAIITLTKITHEVNPLSRLGEIHLGSRIILTYRVKGTLMINDTSYGIYDALYAILEFKNMTTEVRYNISNYDVETGSRTYTAFKSDIVSLKIEIRAYTSNSLLGDYLMTLGFRGYDTIGNFTDILFKLDPKNLTIVSTSKDVIKLGKLGELNCLKYVIKPKSNESVILTEWFEESTLLPVKLEIVSEGTQLILELEDISKLTS